jgi:hypothetical protein
MPSESIPKELAANKAVPLPAKGSKIRPAVTPYYWNKYSTNDAEKASLY